MRVTRERMMAITPLRGRTSAGRYQEPSSDSAFL